MNKQVHCAYIINYMIVEINEVVALKDFSLSLLTLEANH